jgi:hypothetical protein
MTLLWRASTRGSLRVEWMVVAVMAVLAAIAIPRVSGASSTRLEKPPSTHVPLSFQPIGSMLTARGRSEKSLTAIGCPAIRTSRAGGMRS